MLAPTPQEHKNVAPFDDAYENCTCSCGTLLVWLPVEGMPWLDSSSEQPPEIWRAVCVCGVTYHLRKVMQRPSDHSLWYGYVFREDDGDGSL